MRCRSYYSQLSFTGPPTCSYPARNIKHLYLQFVRIGWTIRSMIEVMRYGFDFVKLYTVLLYQRRLTRNVDSCSYIH